MEKLSSITNKTPESIKPQEGLENISKEFINLNTSVQPLAMFMSLVSKVGSKATEVFKK